MDVELANTAKISQKGAARYKGIIFDFNGVLLWDTHLHEKAWKEISASLRGYALNDEEIDTYVHGRPNKYVLEYLLKRPIAHDEFISLSHLKESHYRSLCLELGDAFQLSPGAVELLDYLGMNHIPHTIATASEKNNLDFFVAHLNLGRWFDLKKIVFDDGTYSGKKGMYLKAAANLGLLPEECLVIEDAKSGILAAHEACIGKIIALGPKEKHSLLLNLKGVSDAIVSLEQFPRDWIYSPIQ